MGIPVMNEHIAKTLIDNQLKVDLATEVDRVLAIPETSPALPNAVTTFCDAISKNFESTAFQCIATAEKLEIEAIELRKYAQELRQAAPEVNDHIERWIAFERKANERFRFLATLFKR